MNDTRFHLVALLVTLLLAIQARAQGDLDLMTSSVPPNVIILLDNSGSMNHHLWDDDFDPTVTYSSWCGIASGPTGTLTYYLYTGRDYFDWRRCGVTRRLYHDKSTPEYTRYDANYLNWLFRATSAELADEPQQTRLQAAKQTILDVIDNVNPDTTGGHYEENVRFGLALFRSEWEPDGGYVAYPPEVGNKTSVKAQVQKIRGNTWTPLSETLVDLGRYFAGEDLLGSYPRYSKNNTNGGPGRVQDSPIDVSCRKSFVVIVTDGEPTKDQNNHHGSAFADTIGNADGDSSECAAIGTACSDAPDTGRDDGITYPSDGTDWLDDVAYHLANTDLKPSLDGTQNVITYTIGFTIDHVLLEETAANGNGLYFTTSSPEGLVEKLTDALRDIIRRSTWFAAATVPTSRTPFNDAFFAASFLPSGTEAFWPGHLEAYLLRSDLGIYGVDDQPAVDPVSQSFYEPRHPYWDAYDALAASSPSSRTLYTTKAGAKTDFTKARISAADLGIASSELTLYPRYPTVTFSTTEELADAMVDYLHGVDVFDEDEDSDRTDKREHLLGDIFHSSPIAIGRPSAYLSGEPGFRIAAGGGQSFLEKYGQRERILYVGANDGMLHAFEAGNHQTGDNSHTPETETEYYDLGSGKEVFGYIPGLLLDQVKHIPRNLPRNHYYVDGTPVAADVAVTSKDDRNLWDYNDWATVLITGMRQGDSGYIALDVTDPAADSTGKAHGKYPRLLWEFDQSDAPLGETWSEPVITRVKVKEGQLDHCTDAMTGPPCKEKWVAIFGGGYRDDGNPNLVEYVSDPNSPTWSSRSKGLFMVDVGTGQLLARAAFDPNDAVLSQMRYSIPASPAVLDLDGDGFADVVYAGDLGGQLWRWDLGPLGDDTSSPADGLIDTWKAGVVFRSDPAPMTGGGLHYHSIFFPPVATFLNDELVLAFGSGERSDLRYEGAAQGGSLEGKDDDNNRFWVVWDRMPTGMDPTDPNWVTVGEGHSVINGRTHGLNDVTFLDTDDEPGDDGYFIKVPDGEKFITNHVLYQGILMTLSYVPENDSTDPCNNAGATNIWVFNLEDAGGLLDPASGADFSSRRLRLGPGAPTHPRISVSKDKVVLIGQTSLGNIFEYEVPAEPPPPVELVFWRQLF